MSELKPCPWCLGEATFQHDGDPNYPVSIADSHVEPCPLGFHHLQISYPDEATAAEAWNHRPLESVNADLLEALKELEAALLDGLCNSGVPDFDPERLERARIAACAAISLAEKSNG